MMEVPQGDTVGVDRGEHTLEFREAVARRRGPEIPKRRRVHPLRRQGQRVDFTQKRRNSGDSLEPPVGTTLPSGQPATEGLSDPPGAWSVVFDRDSALRVTVDYDVGLGTIPPDQSIELGATSDDGDLFRVQFHGG